MSSDEQQPASFAAINLFLLSTATFLYKLSRNSGRNRNNGIFESEDGASYRIGSRGIECLRPALPYLGAFIKCCEDPCHPKTNPSGYIALCVAENKLIQERLALRLMPENCSGEAFSDTVAYCYSNMLGLPGAREAVARFLTRKFLRSGENSEHKMVSDVNNQAQTKVDPQHVVLSGGAASIISNILFALCEPGDAVLIPAPYYNAFENDMKLMAKCVPCPIYTSDPVKGPSPKELDSAAAAVVKRGLCLKVVLLTNPNNPLGVIYRRGVMLDCVKWARSKGLHTICDEIYALSCHQKNNAFESILKILDNDLRDDVHMIWALSKDFGASGFRAAFLCTQNVGLLNALGNLNIFTCVSHPIQLVTSDIFNDDLFVDSYLEEARLLTVKSKAICERKLDQMIIPYVKSEAGIFIYADFSAILPQPVTFSDEGRFSEILQNIAHVVMTPGSSQRETRPGMFRICYAWVSEEVLEIAMERISYIVFKIRKLGTRYRWDDISEKYLSEVTTCGISKSGSLHALSAIQ
uniref:Aminotransferase class I/classII large domain-containing protein n=1 Tax=Corethron hystrix TaxID=216773 RepID=A0A7S1C0P6_9STRA|mmetsp:Transcript_767/g.1570  ORF Transcript_767/g.1570 Transcript_767/m.1570 type:complete len:523 (+) Transcript_767:58-1626(+)